MSIDPNPTENEINHSARNMLTGENMVTSDLPDFALDHMATNGNWASGKLTKFEESPQNIKLFGIGVSVGLLAVLLIFLVIWGIFWFFMWLGFFLSWGDCRYNWF